MASTNPNAPFAVIENDKWFGFPYPTNIDYQVPLHSHDD